MPNLIMIEFTDNMSCHTAAYAQWAERGVDPILGSYGTLLDYLGPY